MQWKSGSKVLQIFRYIFISAMMIVGFTACKEKYPVYATFCSATDQKPYCLKYPGIAEEDKTLLENRLGLKEENACPYTLKLTKYRIGSCNNPVVKSTGSDFDGYVRIEILKGFKCYYKVQSDYKNDQEAAFGRVVEQAKKDIGMIRHNK